MTEHSHARVHFPSHLRGLASVLSGVRVCVSHAFK